MAGESEHKTKKRGPPLRVERDDVHIFATGAMYQGALDKEKSLGAHSSEFDHALCLMAITEYG